MKDFFKKSLIFAISASLALVALPVFASAPTLSVVAGNTTANQNYNSVIVSVYGPANAAVQLYYYPTTSYTNTYSNTTPYSYTNSAVFTGTLGTTDSTGSFSVTLSASSYNVPVGAEVYVLVGGQQSNVISWPSATGYYPPTYPYQYSPTTPSYYPAAPTYTAPTTPVETGMVSVGVGQSLTIYAQSGGSYTITSNSNSEIVSASASGSTITIYGNEIGSAAITICPAYYAYGSSPCASVVVTVTPSLSFSQSNITLYGIGLSQTITLTSNSGNGNGQNYYYEGEYACSSYAYNCGQYYVTGNTNPGTVSASVNGNYLYVSAVGYGGSTITVCQTSGTPCGTVYVSVNGASNNYYSNYNYNYPYQQPIVYNTQPIYNIQPIYTQPVYVAPVYSAPQPVRGLRGWMRRY